MNITECVYSPLLEESDSTAGWSKETIEYVYKNRSKVYSSIRGIAKSLSKILPTADVEDIYAEVLLYMYNCDDYNINKAINRSSSGSMVSLEGYVHSCIKYCVMRYVTKKNKREKNIIKETIVDEDGREQSIFDTIPDSSLNRPYENMVYDISAVLKAAESRRYYYGPDLYLVWYIRLLTVDYSDKSVYKDILEVLEVDKKELSDLEKRSRSDELMVSIAKAVTKSNIEDALKEFEKYVYSFERIKSVIENYQ